MTSVLLFDEGPGAGLGHRRRMEALALALHARGWTCRLARAEPDGVTSADVVVVDSYRVRADELRVASDRLVAVDDLARDLAVAVVVDPSPGADATVHRRAGRVLSGAAYALVLRPDPARPVTPADAPVTAVLVTTGAADSDGHGARIAKAVRDAMPGVEVRLVVGPWGASDVPAGVRGVHAPPSLAEELAGAPVVVTAGGVSLLEACALGRAVVAVTLADNQRVAVEALASAGAVLRAGVDDAADAVASLARDATRRRALAGVASTVVDGLGPARVAAEITS